MSNYITDRDAAAKHHTECKEQATKREWSSNGDHRLDGFKAGWDACLQQSTVVKGLANALALVIVHGFPSQQHWQKELYDSLSEYETAVASIGGGEK